MEMLTTKSILSALPHSHPFVFVDRIIERVLGEYVKGVKAVSYNESYFPGHFSDGPILPAVVMIEAASQVAGFLVDIGGDCMARIVGVERFQFQKAVEPGCLLEIEVRQKSRRRNVIFADTILSVEGEKVASGSLQIYVKEPDVKKTETVLGEVNEVER
ncbi:MAG: beta-hydroxyacyl-ACP dehydratase [Gammaproteobacteria bacterium]|nr:beta-hydroxyacyl-ACP dehydratase [Gammaproteobacteria bacterium]